MKIKKYFKRVIGLCGIFLWFGTLTPEIGYLNLNKRTQVISTDSSRRFAMFSACL